MTSFSSHREDLQKQLQQAHQDKAAMAEFQKTLYVHISILTSICILSASFALQNYFTRNITLIFNLFLIVSPFKVSGRNRVSIVKGVLSLLSV